MVVEAELLPFLLSSAGKPLAENFEAAPAGGGKFSLKKKVGPLEVWQWGAATLGVVFAYLAYRNHAANAAGGPSSAPATATTLPAGGGSPPSGETTLSGQLTDLTGQVGALQQSVAGLGNVPVAATTAPSGTGFSNDITNLYGLVGRSPDASGAAYWQNVINTQGLNAAVTQVAGTPEAQAYAAANPTGFVQAEYTTELGRTADPAGLAYWQGRLQTAGAPAQAQAFGGAVTSGAH